MKNKSITKRVLSMVLCVLMLVSCWVFTAPSASAATGPSDTYGNQSITGSGTSTSEPSSGNDGKYRIRLLIYEEDTFDKSVHDNQTYPNTTKGGLTYSTSSSVTSNTGGRRSNDKAAFNTYTSDRNASGTYNNSGNVSNYDYWNEYARITYKNKNGTGSTGYVWFNLGDKDGDGRENIVSSWGSDYGYFPNQDGIVINGFPTSVYARYVEWGPAKSFFIQNKGGFRVWLQIAVWDGNGGWTWPQDTCPKRDGSLDNKYRGGIFEDATVISNTGNGDIIEVSGDVDSSYYPQASSTRYANSGNGVTAVTTAPAVSYTTGTVYCPKTSTAAIQSTNKSDLSFTSPKDQYGTVMMANITTQLSRDDKSATDFTQSGLTTTAKFSANIEDTVSLQYVSPTVTWPQKTGTALSRTLTGSDRLKVYDAQYDVKFKDANGNYIQSGGSDIVRTVYYGSNASAPTPASTYAKPYDTDKHYTFSSWNPSNINVTSDRDCVPQYTGTAHTMVNDDTLPGYMAAGCLTAGVQTRKCSADCGYTDTQSVAALGHHWALNDSSNPTDGSSGHRYYECDRCSDYYTLAVYDEDTKSLRPATEEESTPTQRVSEVESNPQSQVPAPTFDAYTDPTIGNYNYHDRKASLKLGGSTADTTQALRFAGSIDVPAGVSYDVDPTARAEDVDNVILDFGYIYTQLNYHNIRDEADPDEGIVLYEPNNETFKLNGDQVYQMSVVERNADRGTFSSGTWKGVSHHTDRRSGTDIDVLTFNLVIDVSQANYKQTYLARPYIIYKYHGETYTIYDVGIQQRDVFFVAYKTTVVSSSNTKVVDFLNAKVLSHDSEILPDLKWISTLNTYFDNQFGDNFFDNGLLEYLRYEVDEETGEPVRDEDGNLVPQFVYGEGYDYVYNGRNYGDDVVLSPLYDWQ